MFAFFGADAGVEVRPPRSWTDLLGASPVCELNAVTCLRRRKVERTKLRRAAASNTQTPMPAPLQPGRWHSPMHEPILVPSPCPCAQGLYASMACTHLRTYRCTTLHDSNVCVPHLAKVTHEHVAITVMPWPAQSTWRAASIQLHDGCTACYSSSVLLPSADGAPEICRPAAPAGFGFGDLWGVASAVSNSVKTSAGNFVQSVKGTDWKAELSAFSREVESDTQALKAKTNELVEHLPGAVEHLPALVSEQVRGQCYARQSASNWPADVSVHFGHREFSVFLPQDCSDCRYCWLPVHLQPCIPATTAAPPTRHSNRMPCPSRHTLCMHPTTLPCCSTPDETLACSAPISHAAVLRRPP